MLPTLVVLAAPRQVNKGLPFRALRFADQSHMNLVRQFVPLAGVAPNTRANDVFPGGQPAFVAGDDMVEVQIRALENSTAVLASVEIPFKNIVPCELDLFFGQAVEE